MSRQPPPPDRRPVGCCLGCCLLVVLSGLCGYALAEVVSAWVIP